VNLIDHRQIAGDHLDLGTHSRSIRLDAFQANPKPIPTSRAFFPIRAKYTAWMRTETFGFFSRRNVRFKSSIV